MSYGMSRARLAPCRAPGSLIPQTLGRRTPRRRKLQIPFVAPRCAVASRTLTDPTMSRIPTGWYPTCAMSTSVSLLERRNVRTRPARAALPIGSPLGPPRSTCTRTLITNGGCRARRRAALLLRLLVSGVLGLVGVVPVGNATLAPVRPPARGDEHMRNSKMAQGQNRAITQRWSACVRAPLSWGSLIPWAARTGTTLGSAP